MRMTADHASRRRRWQRWSSRRRCRRWRPASGRPGARRRPAPDPAAARRDEAKAAFGRGNTAYNLGKYADAIAEFERAYALSRLPEILFNLGQCYRKQWEAEQRSELGRRALHYYEAVVREAPSAKVRPDAEQFITELTPAVTAAEARERQSKIAAAKGGEALQLAQTMFTGGQLNDAAGVLDRLLREPDNGRELLAEGYLLRGRVAAGMGDPLAAEAQFRRALELRPSIEIADPKGQEAAALEAARKTGAAAACAWCRRRPARRPRTSRRASTSRSRATARRWSRRWSSATGRPTRARS